MRFALPEPSKFLAIATIEPDDNGIERCTCCGKAIAEQPYLEVSVTRTTVYKVKAEDYDDPFDAILADDCEVLHEETLDVNVVTVDPTDTTT